jgi:hypothetical protein
MAFLSVKGDIPLNHIAKLQHSEGHLLPEVAARCQRPTFFRKILQSQK